jgi:hypothetical protein
MIAQGSLSHEELKTLHVHEYLVKRPLPAFTIDEVYAKFQNQNEVLL